MRYLRWGVWLGLVGGLLEAALLGVDRFALGRIVFIGPHVVWMAPLANALLFGAIGGVIGLGVRLVPRVPASLASFALTLPPLFGIFIYYHPRLHAYAGLTLSAGCAVQLSRLFRDPHGAGDRLVRRTFVPVSLVVVLAAASIFGWQAWSVRRASAGLGPAPSSPSVLLIVLDTVRAKSLSLYGYGRRTTPELEAFARTGVRFDRAIAPAPWTGPTHASMFTGQYPGSLSVGWRTPLDDTYVTLAEALRDRGYDTRGFVANTFGCTFERGLDRGFIEYRDYPVSAGEVARSSSLVRGLLGFYRVRRWIGYYDNPGRKNAPEITDEFLGWLDAHQGRPFFAFLNYFDAHDPYQPPPPFDSFFGPNPRGNPWIVKRWWDPTSYTAADVVAERRAYEGAIAFLDREMGRLVAELRRRGTLDRTLVIITSDHGEEFGEHKRVGHGHSLFMELLHVPLIVSFPAKVPSGVVVSQPATLRDLPATIEDVLGLPATGFAGRSLSRHWQATPAAPDPILAELDLSRSVVSSMYHYIKNPRRERVFDVGADPDEQRDLVDTGQAGALLPGLRSALDDLVRADRKGGARKAPGKNR